MGEPDSMPRLTQLVEGYRSEMNNISSRMKIGSNHESNEGVITVRAVKRAEQYAQAGNTVGKYR